MEVLDTHIAMARTQISSIVRTFEILEILSKSQNVTPTELAHDLDMPVSTVHNYLTTLEDIDYTIKEKGQYSLSPKLLALGSRMRLNSDFYTCAKPVVQGLAKETNSQGAIGIKEGDMVTFLHIFNNSDRLDIKNYPGMNLPLHATANGKVVLAEMPEEELHSYIDSNLQEFTDTTHTDLESLSNELEIIRERGFAYNDEEFERGVVTIATPVRKQEELIGTISVTDLKKRMEEPDYKKKVIEKILEAANIIEINLSEHPATLSTGEL